MGDMETKDGACDAHEEDCKARKKVIDVQRGKFEADWPAAVSTYNSGIDEAEGNFTASKTRVEHDEGDRKEEWKSTQEIKCMLLNYQAGGTFDQSAMETCQSKVVTDHLVINYVPIPDRVVWTKPVFTELTDWSAYATDCHEEEKADEAADTNCEIV